MKAAKRHIWENRPQLYDVNSSHRVKVVQQLHCHISTMAGEVLTSSSLSESDGDSILSGSVRYSTDLSEDSEAISEPEEVDEPARDEVLPYLFEPERRSRTYSESEDETTVVTGDSGEERIGNTNW